MYEYPNSRLIGEVVNQCVEKKAHKAICFLTEKLVIRATRRLFRKKIPAAYENIDIVLVVGRPNFEERKFIKMCKKVGEPFPVKKIQFKMPPKPRK